MHARKRLTGSELREEFRTRNIAIADAVNQFLQDGTAEPGREISFMCECAIPECDGMLSLTLDEFDYVQSGDKWYAALPAHVDGTGEVPVSKHESYWIVRASD